MNSQLILKDPSARKDGRQEEKGTTEDEMVRWYHRLNGHEFEHVPGAGDRQEGLACCSPWGCKELDMTKWLNSTELGSLLFPGEGGLLTVVSVMSPLHLY